MTDPRSVGGTPREGARPAPIAATDALIAFGLAVLAVLAWATPARAWPRLGRAFAPVAGRVMARRHRASVARIRALGGDRVGACAPEAVERELAATYVEDVLQVLRELRPGGWRPPIRLVGREHVDAALARGRGVILWVSHYAFYSLVSKMALHREGYSVSHLSHPRHGFSATRFGMRVLNPVRNAAEDRYLRARVFLGLNDSASALRDLAARLNANEIVSITAREAHRRPLIAPFLAGRIGLAAGAPDLAYKTGAALLPVHTLARGDGGFDVVVEAPLPVDTGLPRAEAYARAAVEYARRLEPLVRAYPGQWRGWHYH